MKSSSVYKNNYKDTEALYIVRINEICFGAKINKNLPTLIYEYARLHLCSGKEVAHAQISTHYMDISSISQK